MKNLFLLIVFCLFIQCIGFSSITLADEPANGVYFVSPSGSDSNQGTIDSPFATLERAKQAANAIKNTVNADVTVYFRGGTYKVDKTVAFKPEDSGKKGAKIIYTAYPGEKPVFDAGVDIKNWKLYKDGIYRAKVDGVEDFREFYVDGASQQRARTKPIQGFGRDENDQGFKVLTKDLPPVIKHQEDLQTFNNWKWRIYYLPIDKLKSLGDYTMVYFKKPYITTYLYRFNFEQNFTSWFFIENALELLDEPGEWYYDKHEKYVYYKPAQGVDINELQATAPCLEQFINIKGEGLSKRVEHITFKDFTFTYPGWINPNTEGFCSVQATSRVGDNGAYTSMMHGSIMADFVDSITFEGNIFTHTAANAITMEKGVSNILINGNIFCDIGGAAISIGTARRGKLNEDEIAHNIIFSNNVLRNIGSQYWNAPAVTYMYTQDSAIIHNDMDGMSYSGVSLGWGWSRAVTEQKNNIVGYNKIVNFNRKVIDGAAIYSLSTNPGSSYVGNYVKNIGSPFNTAALYHDEQSGGFDDHHNVVEAEKQDMTFYNLNRNNNITIRDSYTNTGAIISNRPEENIVIKDVHIVPDSNWPQEAMEIIGNAGLENDYKHLLEIANKITLPRPKKPIIRSLGIEEYESKMFVPVDFDIDTDYLKAPYKEENGSVVIDATEFNPDYYVGYDASVSTWMGALGAYGYCGKYVSKTALYLLQRNDIKRDKKIHKGQPTVGYDIQFQTSGEYYIFVRAKSNIPGENKLQLAWDDTSIGKLALEKDMKFKNIGNGVPIKIQVKESGIHKLTISAIDLTEGTALDRIWITKNTTDVKDGSDISGPLMSKKVGNYEYVDIPQLLTTDQIKPDTPNRINYALNNPTWSSGDYSNGYNASAANDGKLISEWVSNSNSDIKWWMVDLKKPINVTEIEVCFRVLADQPKTRTNFEVQGSNDFTFKTYTVLAMPPKEATPFAQRWSAVVDSPESYRYVRLKKTVAAQDFALGEVRVYSDKMEMISQSKKVTSSNDIEGYYGAKNVNDGDINTVWSVGQQKDYWVQIDLDTPSTINRVEVVPRLDADYAASRKDFKVLASNDSEFKEFEVIAENADAPFQSNTTWSKSVSLPKKYRYVRYVKEGNYVSISELKVYSIFDITSASLIENFKVNGQIGEAKIDTENNSVNVVVDDKTDLKTIKPVITLSKDGLLEPKSGQQVDFSSGSVIYKVTQTNGKTYSWNVNIEKKEPLPKPVGWSDFTGWTGETASVGNGMTVKKESAKYTAKKMENEMISFNLKYKFSGANAWSGFALRSQSADKNILKGDTAYLVCFKDDVWELQKWRDGKREMLIGTFKDLNPRFGTLKNSQFLSDTENHIMTGAINQKDGVRLVLFCNGQRIFDVIDKENPITEPGYLEMFADSGELTIYPPNMPMYIQKLKHTIAMLSDNPNAIVDSLKKSMDEDDKVVPIINNGRTLVPIRFIAESLGAAVDWQPTTNSVKISKQGQETISFVIGSTSYFVGEKEDRIEAAPQIINNRTYIPLRAVSEALGKSVIWDNSGLILIGDEANLIGLQADKETLDNIIKLIKK